MCISSSYGQYHIFQLKVRSIYNVGLRQFPTSSIPTLSIPTLSTLTKWELTKWELTKWEIDKVGIDEVGINRLYTSICKYIRVLDQSFVFKLICFTPHLRQSSVAQKGGRQKQGNQTRSRTMKTTTGTRHALLRLHYCACLVGVVKCQVAAVGLSKSTRLLKD